ncbi:MAG: alpha/beta hydrolase [Acidovorax sp.]|nr:alpha/beta hydrolase [Acidovorax sp.]
MTLVLAAGFSNAQTANSDATAALNQNSASQSLGAAASASEWQKMGKTFDFGDQKAFYVDQGTGKATIAIHGFPTSSWDFRRMTSSFSKAGRFIAPDLLGFGFSGKSTDTTYTIAKHADLIVALTQHLGLTSARLIGADVGASVVQELLARQLDAKLPFTIESAVFINGSLFAEQFKPTSGQSSLLGAFGGVANRAASESAVVGGLIQVTGPEKRIPAAEWGSVWTLVNYPSDSRILHKVLPSTSEREANDSRWTNAICKTKTPQMMILGLADPTGSRQMYELAQAKCKASQTFSVMQNEKSGHFPHIEYPEETSKAILAWRQGGF